MKIRRSVDHILIDFTGAEARAFLNELLDVPRGTRLPKLSQVCTELDVALKLPVVLPQPVRLTVVKGK